MKKISTSSLQFEKNSKITNLNSSTNNTPKISKLNSNNNDTEFFDSFGDDVLDFFGSNNITKGSALEVLEEERLDFFDKGDIEEAIKCGVNGENIKVILKNGESFLFVPDGDSYKLSSYSNNSGDTCYFENGLYELWDNIYGGNNLGTSISLNDITLIGDTLILEMDDGVEIRYDTSDNYRITSFGLNGTTYTMDQIEQGLNKIKEEKLNEANERKNNMGSHYPGMKDVEREIQEIQEKYTVDNIEKFEIHDGEVTIKLKDSSGNIYVNFEGSRASSVEYRDPNNSPYINGFVEREI